MLPRMSDLYFFYFNKPTFHDRKLVKDHTDPKKGNYRFREKIVGIVKKICDVEEYRNSKKQ